MAFANSIYSMISGLGQTYTDAQDRGLAQQQAAQERALRLQQLEQERAGQAEIATNLMEMLRGGGAAPSPSSPVATGGAPPSGLPSMAGAGPMADYARSIQGIESGGNYAARGPVINKGSYAGDRALGAYQIMGRNLPEWSQAALGRQVTPDEFVGSKEIQDQIFNHRFGSLVQKYGNPQDAASAWLTGRPLAEATRSGVKDQLGTGGQEYVAKFNRGLGGAPMQMAGPPPATMAGAASTPTLAGGDGVQPAASGGRLEVIRNMLRSGNPTVRAKGIELAQRLGAAEPVKGVEINGRLVDPTSGRLIADYSDAAKPKDLIKFAPGEVGYDPNTRQQVFAAPPKVDPDKGPDLEGKLRAEFSKETKPFVDVQDAYGRVISAVQQRQANPDKISPASDIGLVFGFMKMLDPGSVVKETEFATAQNAAGVPDRVRNAYNKALSGEFLTDEQRQDFVGTAGALYSTARKGAENTAQRYQGLAKQYGVDPGRSAALPELLQAPQIAKPQGGPPAKIVNVDDYAKLPKGATYVAPDGSVRTKQ